MKKTIYLTAITAALCLVSCGPNKEDISKTCACEDLFTKMKAAEAEYQVSDRISSSEAQKKVQSENQEAYDNCIKAHKDIGDDNYFKASQQCNSK